MTPVSVSGTEDVRPHGGGFANYTLPSFFTLKRTFFIFLARNAEIASSCLGKILWWGKIESRTPVEGTESVGPLRGLAEVTASEVILVG